MSRNGVVISTYVAPAEATKLRERAANGDRSVAAEVRRALRGYLLTNETQAAQPAFRTTSAESATDHEPYRPA